MLRASLAAEILLEPSVREGVEAVRGLGGPPCSEGSNGGCSSLPCGTASTCISQRGVTEAAHRECLVSVGPRAREQSRVTPEFEA